ncbi:DUF4173 domain-containing protein [Planosporangium thailandense]|uniref:DUF4173 domain-containing protein n=1 Tax=Planosporangium thailandense TaxID=765197 RepID=A0ABX0XSR2_9ACTN|nr:DUF4173 domain-containing protein [Planosporangium thailandense]NJC68932.1 DUF4173 domain-containing protein [Planosporangium thailandense]
MEDNPQEHVEPPATPATPAPEPAARPPRPRRSPFPAARWEAARRPAGRPVLATVAVAAVLAAGTLTMDRPGLGWLLTGLALAGVAAAASVELRVRPDLSRCLWAAAGIALLAVGAVRAADWLYAVCVPAAVACAVQALLPGGSVRAMLAGALAGPVAVLRALPWAGRGLRALVPHGRPQAAARLLASIGVSGLLLVVFGALFASADGAFAGLLARIVPDVDLRGVPGRLFLFVAVALGALGGAYLVAAPPRLPDPAEPRRPLRLAEWALPVALLDALFGLFVLVQLTVLFGGRGHVLRPGGPDFAQYARSGFWQLSAVTGLTLVVIGVVARAAPRTGRLDRAAIRVLVGALAILTLVIVASALKRMGLYEDTYGYTRLRLAVSATELWLGVLFALVLVAGVRLRTTWLPRAVLISAVLGLLAFAAADPDRFIAARNVDRFERTGRVDVFYLSELSADAAPELVRLPADRRADAVAPIRQRLQRDSWYSYNFGRARARTVLRP